LLGPRASRPQTRRRRAVLRQAACALSVFALRVHFWRDARGPGNRL